MGCRYFAEVGYPEPVDVGVVGDKVGRSSVVYRVGLFQGEAEEAAAEGRFVHVYVDNTDPARPVVPMPDADPRTRSPPVAAGRGLSRPMWHGEGCALHRDLHVVIVGRRRASS